ncbi:MAG TPA: hypothetical protein PLV25_04845, partial [Opitutales bacterium]|nr:hypothetical protein [Opitutales bacterium]
GDGQSVCHYRYRLTPGWPTQGQPGDWAGPKRLLVDVRRGGLCQPLDKQMGWKGSNELIWKGQQGWPDTHSLGVTRGQLESFLNPPLGAGVLPQSGANLGEQVLPSFLALASRHYNNRSAVTQRPRRLARYARPVKIQVDCFLKVLVVRNVGNAVALDVDVIASPHVEAFNPYDTMMEGAPYRLKMEAGLWLDRFFYIQAVDPAKGVVEFEQVTKPNPQKACSLRLRALPASALSPVQMEVASSDYLALRRIQHISPAAVIKLPYIGKNKLVTMGRCLWQLESNEKDACELESMHKLSMNWVPHEGLKQGFRVSELVAALKANPQALFPLGSFITKTPDLAVSNKLDRALWAPILYPDEGSMRWACSGHALGKSLELRSFVGQTPRSLMDVIHWGEWNPYPVSPTIPFRALLPEGCPANAYTWSDGGAKGTQLLDMAWLMGESLLDRYYLSTQQGIRSGEDGWADYGLNVNDANPARWAHDLKLFLDPGLAQDLAGACVDVLKKRGPYLGLADFVNRRLVDGPQGDCGAFEAACEQVGICESMRLELIAQLLPGLSAREDAFTIEIEVELRHAKSGRIQGSKKLRMLVQRDAQYLEAEQEGALGLGNPEWSRKWRLMSMETQTEE